jgi:hypothetical protein
MARRMSSATVFDGFRKTFLSAFQARLGIGQITVFKLQRGFPKGFGQFIAHLVG